MSVGWFEGIPDPPRPEFLVGVDLAQAQDFTAIAVIQKVTNDDAQASYQVRHLDRFQGKAYTEIGRHLARLVTAIRSERPRPEVSVIYDRTGVGVAAGDVLDEAGIAADLHGVSIHGGDRVSEEGRLYRVPKRDLVSVIAVALQDNRLKIAADLMLAPVLTQELSRFRLKFNPQTAHDSYSSWREKDHDDTVLAVAIALWWGERDVGRFEVVAQDDPLGRFLNSFGI